MSLENDFKHRLMGMMRAQDWHVSPVETGETCPGFPDLEWCTPFGVSGTSELKAVPRGYRVKFTKFQPSWHVNRSRCHGDSSILIYVSKVRGVYVYRSSDVLDLVEQGIKLAPMAIMPENTSLLKLMVAIAKANPL